MATVVFTPHLRRHVGAETMECAGGTVQTVLDRACADKPNIRSYLFDDQGRLRKHVNVFVDGRRLTHRDSLDAPVEAGAELYVMQALSGG
jgi:molybdopterin converting factor small subunit